LEGKTSWDQPSRAVTATLTTLDRNRDQAKEWGVIAAISSTMVSSLNQAEVLIALVVAAHAGVLAVRLAFSLYKA
jgi:photosystem I subunit 12